MPTYRLKWLRILSIIGLLSGLIISWQLWLPGRAYPRVPILSFIISDSLQYILLGIAIISLFGSLHKRASTYFLPIYFITSIIFVMHDQSRLQPWFYQYNFILFVCWINRLGNSERPNELQAIQYILVGTYLWSGIQKLNHTFITETGPSLFNTILPLDIGWGMLIIPIFEVSLAVMLLGKKTRNYAVSLLVIMHLTIFLILSPLISNHNAVVWPWNIISIGLVIAAFWNSAQSIYDVRIHTPIVQFTLLLFLLLPGLNLFNAWDEYLSSSLYSGKHIEGTIYFSSKIKKRLPLQIQNQLSREDGINLDHWSYTELNVPSYPETRIYDAVHDTLCKDAVDPLSVVLEIKKEPEWLTGKRETEMHYCNGKKID